VLKYISLLSDFSCILLVSVVNFSNTKAGTVTEIEAMILVSLSLREKTPDIFQALKVLAKRNISCTQ